MIRLPTLTFYLLKILLYEERAADKFPNFHFQLTSAMLSILCRNNLIRGLKVPPNATALMLASAHFSSGTKRLTILEDLRGLKNAPAPALTLGLSGLIPFLAAPWYMTYNVSCFSTGEIFG